jgi:hypothetical protein
MIDIEFGIKNADLIAKNFERLFLDHYIKADRILTIIMID